MQIAFQLTELFQIEIDAVIYTDQFTCYIGTWTSRLKLVELCGIYGPQTISMHTAFRWVKAFKAGKFSVENDTRPGRPKTSVTKANIAAYQKTVCKQFWKSVWTWERFALGGYLICSLRSKRHNALNVPENFWKHTKAVIVRLFLTC